MGIFSRNFGPPYIEPYIDFKPLTFKLRLVISDPKNLRGWSITKKVILFVSSQLHLFSKNVKFIQFYEDCF